MSGAPILSLLTLVLVIGIVWTVLHFLYKHRMDGLKEEIDRLRARESTPPVKARALPAPRPMTATPAAAKKKNSPAPASASPPEKVFVPDGVTPSSLMALCDGKTAMQAEALTNVYVGKWIEISGSLTNISDHGESLYVSVNVATVFSGMRTTATVWLTFKGDRDFLEMLQKGAQLVAIGKIRRIRNVSMDFDDCELIPAP